LVDWRILLCDGHRSNALCLSYGIRRRYHYNAPLVPGEFPWQNAGSIQLFDENTLGFSLVAASAWALKFAQVLDIF
jgi:hypothetical protein